MALTLDAKSNGSISLAEYVDYVTRSVDLQDPDAVIESATHLHALGENKKFIVERINQELESAWDQFQPDNSYSAQTLTLGSGKDFSIRANMWLPTRPGGDGWDERLYAYGLPHDHNFSFLTVGYVGSGYWTEIYEYDSRRVVGYPGEDIDLAFIERTRLPAGKVMFYRASRDIHTQEPPDDFSMSLNLLIVSPSVRMSNQYTFDLENRKIRGYVPNAGGGRVMLARLAKYVGDGRTACILDAIASRHPQPRLRWTAYESLAKLDNANAVRIYECAANDRDPFVRRQARDLLDEAIP